MSKGLFHPSEFVLGYLQCSCAKGGYLIGYCPDDEIQALKNWGIDLFELNYVADYSLFHKNRKWNIYGKNCNDHSFQLKEFNSSETAEGLRRSFIFDEKEIKIKELKILKKNKEE